ncbi:cytochrome P450 [Periconia macrospinosa]|uniref:Cytochrome P450 n=1 Tax=Periconia macrospinosa TaxID=97972 RepID=A0A2V1DQF0_9PLEO|nr:cytochrome P450 [Periconia macrospinosa]
MCPHIVTQAFIFAVVCGFVHFLFLLHHHRSKINKLRNQGMPMPKEWSWATGHLLTLWRYKNKFPRDAFVGTALTLLAADFSDTEAFVMDLWPVAPAILIVYSPELSTQISTKYNLLKEESFEKSLGPITGGPNMLTMNGEQWKMWRAIFNPGFSAASMQDYVPHVVSSVETFCELLDKKTREGDIFRLGDLTMRLTADVITKLTLNTSLDCQRSENLLGDGLQAIIRWHSLWDPFVLMNPLRPIVQRYHSWRINRYIQRELRKQFLEQISGKPPRDAADSGRVKSIASLILESSARSKPSKLLRTRTGIDHHFINLATNQIRLFLFAGSDTTSSSIIYTYHLLSQHPGVLEKLRAEHTAIFGPDPSKAADLLRNSPILLNKCRYTMAVIKETLRLYSPAATMRAGGDGIVLRDRTNYAYPMEHLSVSIIHRAVHLNPRVWPRPREFLPDRFLVDRGHELYPNPAAYRPFEQGPRACIGQNMVYNEMRIVLILTARKFIIKPAYEEWRTLHRWKREWIETFSGDESSARWEIDEHVFGDRAYQTEKAGTHPKNGYPCRVEVLHNE